MTMMLYLWDQHKRSLVGSPDAASNTLLVKEHMAVVCEDGLWSLLSCKTQRTCLDAATYLSLLVSRERIYSLYALLKFWWPKTLSHLSVHFSVVPPYRFSCYIPFTTPTLFAYIIAFDNKDDRYYKDGSTGRVNFVVDTCMYTQMNRPILRSLTP